MQRLTYASTLGKKGFRVSNILTSDDTRKDSRSSSIGFARQSGAVLPSFRARFHISCFRAINRTVAQST